MGQMVDTPEMAAERAMKNEEQRKNIVEFLKKELSYDASGGKTCPKCGEVIEAPDYWIDHRSSLAANLATFLGFGSGMATKIDDLLSDPYVTGNKNRDAEILADHIMEEIYL